MTDLERQLIERFRRHHLRRLFLALRQRLESIAYAPGWEGKR